MQLSIKAREQDPLFIATIAGEVDAHTAADLRDCLKKAAGDGFSEIVLDFSGVPFIDSTGIGVLVGALRRARENDGSVTLVGIRDNVERIFVLLGLDEQFVLVDNHDGIPA